MLLMKKIFFDAIRDGSKRTTLRYWKRANVRAGQTHTVPGLGRVRIDEIVPVPWEALGHADAVADGFSSLAKLRAALDEMYSPEQQAGRTLFRIRFTFPAI